MILVDSHAHIYTKEFKDDIGDVIERAKEAGVEKIYMPNVDHESIESMMNLAQKYPGYCIPMMGLHPCSVEKDFEKHLYEVEELLSKEKFVAVGEMGTDLYWDKTFYEQQKEAFNIQCELALKNQLPIVIHCRESIDETIELVRPFSERGLKGVFHCFTGSIEQASAIIDLNFKLGLGGVATFKNGGLEPVIQKVSLEHIMLETDSPYLAPTPNRGKRNEPAYVKLVAEKIAAVLDKDVEEIGEITSRNSNNLFINP
ncbi:MAG: hydrolase TatD [Flammeovirgaceae bacterium]|nr:hydrolase TatD [Flammeovirgaceae bacterium]MBE62492.1 hydrolase TatD [Flammeovirgaceae bacterium]HCX22264.1 hydrolase TatD [Cytophagales bacterium]|tara:strand:+ start:4939 stop:5709 length:771 start_codon:yes stop_codon:yes gene_type:complete